jgi:hypothetical protein
LRGLESSKLFLQAFPKLTAPGWQSLRDRAPAEPRVWPATTENGRKINDSPFVFDPLQRDPSLE